MSGLIKSKIMKLIKNPIELIFVFLFPVEILFLIGQIFGGNIESFTSAFLYKSRGILDGMYPGIVFVVFIIYLCIILPVDILEEKKQIPEKIYSPTAFFSYSLIYAFILFVGLSFMNFFGYYFYKIRIPEFSSMIFISYAVLFIFFFSFGFMISLIFSRKNSLLIVTISYFLPEIFLNNSIVPLHIMSTEAQNYSKYLLTSKLVRIFKSYYCGKNTVFTREDLFSILIPVLIFLSISIVMVFLKKKRVSLDLK